MTSIPYKTKHQLYLMKIPKEVTKAQIEEVIRKSEKLKLKFDVILKDGKILDFKYGYLNYDDDIPEDELIKEFSKKSKFYELFEARPYDANFREKKDFKSNSSGVYSSNSKDNNIQSSSISSSSSNARVKPGYNYIIRMTYFESIEKFYVRLLDDEGNYNRMMEAIANVKQNCTSVRSQADARRSWIYAAPYKDENDYYRVEVLGWENYSQVTVKYIDFGDDATVNANSLIILPRYMSSSQPPFAHACSVYSLAEYNPKFDGKAIYNQICHIKVREIHNSVWKVDLIVDGNDIGKDLYNLETNVFYNNNDNNVKQCKNNELTSSINNNNNINDNNNSQVDGLEEKIGIVTACHAPDHVYIQDQKDLDNLKVISEILEKVRPRLTHSMNIGPSVTSKKIYLAKRINGDEQTLHRCHIYPTKYGTEKRFITNNEFHDGLYVHFIDKGDWDYKKIVNQKVENTFACLSETNLMHATNRSDAWSLLLNTPPLAKNCRINWTSFQLELTPDREEDLQKEMENLIGKKVRVEFDEDGQWSDFFIDDFEEKKSWRNDLVEKNIVRKSSVHQSGDSITEIIPSSSSTATTATSSVVVNNTMDCFTGLVTCIPSLPLGSFYLQEYNGNFSIVANWMRKPPCVNHQNPNFTTIETIQVGKLYGLFLSHENYWVRVKVECVLDTGNVQVQLIDFGIKENVKMEYLMELPNNVALVEPLCKGFILDKEYWDIVNPNMIHQFFKIFLTEKHLCIRSSSNSSKVNNEFTPFFSLSFIANGGDESSQSSTKETISIDPYANNDLFIFEKKQIIKPLLNKLTEIESSKETIVEQQHPIVADYEQNSNLIIYMSQLESNVLQTLQKLRPFRLLFFIDSSTSKLICPLWQRVNYLFNTKPNQLNDQIQFNINIYLKQLLEIKVNIFNEIIATSGKSDLNDLLKQRQEIVEDSIKVMNEMDKMDSSSFIQSFTDYQQNLQFALNSVKFVIQTLCKSFCADDDVDTTIINKENDENLDKIFQQLMIDFPDTKQLISIQSKSLEYETKLSGHLKSWQQSIAFYSATFDSSPTFDTITNENHNFAQELLDFDKILHEELNFFLSLPGGGGGGSATPAAATGDCQWNIFTSKPLFHFLQTLKQQIHKEIDFVKSLINDFSNDLTPLKSMICVLSEPLTKAEELCLQLKQSDEKIRETKRNLLLKEAHLLEECDDNEHETSRNPEIEECRAELHKETLQASKILKKLLKLLSIRPEIARFYFKRLTSRQVYEGIYIWDKSLLHTENLEDDQTTSIATFLKEPVLIREVNVSHSEIQHFINWWRLYKNKSYAANKKRKHSSLLEIKALYHLGNPPTVNETSLFSIKLMYSTPTNEIRQLNNPYQLVGSINNKEEIVKAAAAAGMMNELNIVEIIYACTLAIYDLFPLLPFIDCKSLQCWIYKNDDHANIAIAPPGPNQLQWPSVKQQQQEQEQTMTTTANGEEKEKKNQQIRIALNRLFEHLNILSFLSSDNLSRFENWMKNASFNTKTIENFFNKWLSSTASLSQRHEI